MEAHNTGSDDEIKPSVEDLRNHLSRNHHKMKKRLKQKRKLQHIENLRLVVENNKMVTSGGKNNNVPASVSCCNPRPNLLSSGNKDEAHLSDNQEFHILSSIETVVGSSSSILTQHHVKHHSNNLFEQSSSAVGCVIKPTGDRITVEKQKYRSYYHYCKPKLQRILEGTTKEVEVVFVFMLNLFTCRLVENEAIFQRLMADLSAYADSPIADEEIVPQKNTACIVKNSVDNRWYRGLITEIFESELEIRFMDVGEIRRVPYSFVKTITKEFVVLPPQFYYCTVDGEPAGAWTLEEKIYFETLTQGKRLTATFPRLISKKLNGKHKFGPTYPVILNENQLNGPPIVINELFKTFRATLAARNVPISKPEFGGERTSNPGMNDISEIASLNVDAPRVARRRRANANKSPERQRHMNIEPRTPDRVVKPVSSPESSPVVLCQISKEDKKRSFECITLSDSESESNEDPLQVKKLCTDSNMDIEEQASNVSSESELEIAPVENEDTALLSVSQEPKLNGHNFLLFPGIRGATLYFETSEGHFYRDMKCVDSQFFWLRESAEKDDHPNEAMGCQVKPGGRHQHEVVPRELVELAMLRWACILRVLHHVEEPVLQSVEFTIGSWPHKLPIAVSRFCSKFSDTFKRFRKEFSEGKVIIRNFMNRHGEDQLACFRQLILESQPYWSSPIPVGPEGHLQDKSLKPKSKRPHLEESNEEEIETSWTLLTESDDSFLSDKLEDVPTLDEPKTIPPCNNDEADQPTPMKARKIRFAERLVEHLEKIGRRNEKDLYAVPLTKSTVPETTTFDRFCFHEDNVRIEGFVPNKQKAKNKTILFVGDTGSGKTSLINEMINFVFGVKWEDPFRFQLVENQVSSEPKTYIKTGRITIYKIQHMEGFRVPFSLTIIDTPGYDKNESDSDVALMEMIRQLFEDKNGIQKLDHVAIVSSTLLPSPTQSYIHDLVLSNLGKDLLENIIFLFTFATDQEPRKLKSIVAYSMPRRNSKLPLYFKFNSSDCLGRNQADHISESHWWMGVTNFNGFFDNLSKMDTKSVSLSRQVLEERELLEARVDELQSFVKTGLKQLEDIKQARRFLTACQTRMETIQNTDKNGRVVREESLPPGEFATNCLNCDVTCFLSSQKEKTVQCTYCPQKCSWNLHTTGSVFKWCEYVTETSINNKELYLAELKNLQTANDDLERLQQEFNENRSALLELRNAASGSIQRLEETALVSNPYWMRSYSIQLMIINEQKEKRKGFEKRVSRLEKRRLKSITISKIKKEETLLTLDVKSD